MAKFEVTIDDDAQLAGITMAREAYNAALPDVRDKDSEVVEPKPDTIDTDEAYIQHVMAGAAASYATQYKSDVAKIDSEIAVLQDKRAEIIRKGRKGVDRPIRGA